MEEIIRICDVRKEYGSEENVTKAVNGVNFIVNKGSYVGIMGASGSGKTTMLNLIATIDRVTSGQIFFQGTDITSLNDQELSNFRKNYLGFVFQDFNLLDTLTIEENIELAMAIRNRKKEEIDKSVDEITRKLRIGDIRKKFPYQVSGGQKQRCACARAIANRPELILADEPTGALDSKAAKALLDTFLKMQEEFGATILMVTHDAFSASYCQRILFMRDGKLYRELENRDKSQREFLLEILDVMSETGEVENVQ
jgi:putative ABC transport system ATP-binding protein